MFILFGLSAFHFDTFLMVLLLAEGWRPILLSRVAWTGKPREKPLTKFLHDSTTTTMVRRHFKRFKVSSACSTFRKGVRERFLWRTAPGRLWCQRGRGWKADSLCRRRWSSHEGRLQNLLQTLGALSKLGQVSQLRMSRESYFESGIMKDWHWIWKWLIIWTNSGNDGGGIGNAA